MSSLAVSLKLEPRVPLVARTSRNPYENIQNLPKDCFFCIFSFLNPTELASAERISRTWWKMINSKNQEPWREQCRIQRVAVISPCIEEAIGNYSSKNVEGVLDDRIQALITEYDAAGTNYKVQATVARGWIMLSPDHLKLLEPDEEDSMDFPVAARINFPMFNPRDSVQGQNEHLWQVNPPTERKAYPFEIQPGKPYTYISLLAFINEDGSYKNDGDKLKFRWQGRQIILTCRHRVYSYKDTRIKSFREAIVQRIKATFESLT